MVMKLRHIVIYPQKYQIVYHSGMVVSCFQAIRNPNDVYSDQSVPKGDKFILGTDNLGRSLAKRVIVGIRISLLIAIVATLIDLIIGVTYGLVSGFLGGKIDPLHATCY